MEKRSNSSVGGGYCHFLEILLREGKMIRASLGVLILKTFVSAQTSPVIPLLSSSSCKAFFLLQGGGGETEKDGSINERRVLWDWGQAERLEGKKSQLCGPKSRLSQNRAALMRHYASCQEDSEAVSGAMEFSCSKVLALEALPLRVHGCHCGCVVLQLGCL